MLHRFGAVCLCLAFLVQPATAQSLDDRLDEDAFLRGLIEYEMAEVLEHYISTHPPADEIQAARYELARLRLRLRRAPTDAPDRAPMIESLLRIRSELLERHQHDRRWALWAADQAEDLLYQLLPQQASGLTTMFGLPSPKQRTRAQRVAREMFQLTRAAENAINIVILQLEAAEDYAENRALQAERRRLAREQRDRRIAFLQAVAALLHAEINPTEPSHRRELWEASSHRLTPLIDELQGGILHDAELYCGYARARLGRFDDAETMFRAAATAEDSTPRQIFAARMGGVMNRAVTRGPDAALRGLRSIKPRYAEPDEIFYRVLIADQEFLLRRRAALQSGQTSQQALSAALHVYLDLLEHEQSLPAPSIRAIVLDKLAIATADARTLDPLPPIATVARAEQLRRENRDLDAAIRLHRHVLRRDDAEARDRAIALFGLGRAQLAARRPFDAMRSLIEMARQYPRDPQSPDALGLAASIGSELHQADPTDPAIRTALREALTILLERHRDLPSIDRWRYVAGRLEMSEANHRRAAAWFAEVSPDSNEWVDARFMYASALHAAAGATLPDETPETRRNRYEQARLAAQAAANAVQIAEQSAPDERRRHLAHYRALLSVFQASALIELNRPRDALPLLHNLEQNARLDRSTIAVVLRTRVHAYRALGESEAARQEIQRFTETAPREAVEVIDALLEPLLEEVRQLLDEQQDDQASRLAQQELLPLAEHLQRSLTRTGLDNLVPAATLRRAADAYRYAGRPREALALYDRAQRDFPDAVEIHFGRAECLFQLGGPNLAEAMTLYKRIAASPEQVGHHRYWQSQLRMLQILDAVQRNTGKILPRINRLKLEDPTLGGPRYEREFRRLESQYS